MSVTPSSGQSQSDTSTALRGIDKFFDTQIRLLPDSPFFKVTADDAISKKLVEDAFAEGMHALEATAYEQPRPLLIKLIQTGKLTQVGFALPVPIAVSRVRRASRTSLISRRPVWFSAARRGVRPR